MSVTSKSVLSDVDYGVFGGSLAISLAIGAYYACKSRKDQSGSGLLVIDRSQKPLSVGPMAASVVASYLSAITILGQFIFMLSFFDSLLVHVIVILFY